MKAVPPNALRGEPPRQSKSLRQLRLAAMESGVETRDLRHLRRSLPDGAYRGKVMRLMKRRQGLEIRQIDQHVRRHADGAIVMHAAMHHSVPDADDRGSREKRGDDGGDLTSGR